MVCRPLTIEQNVFGAIRAQPGQQQIDQYLLNHQWAYTVVKLAVSTVAEFFGGPWAATGASATFDGYFTYEHTGNIWAARRAGGIDMAEAYANYVIEGVTAGNYAENVAAHAALGCVSSRVAGGSCGSGAISGATGPAIGDRLNVASDDFAALAENVAIHSLVAGLSSRLAGGSFSTGAETAAFAYLFSQGFGSRDGRASGSGGADLCVDCQSMPGLMPVVGTVPVGPGGEPYVPFDQGSPRHRSSFFRTARLIHPREWSILNCHRDTRSSRRRVVGALSWCRQVGRLAITATLFGFNQRKPAPAMLGAIPTATMSSPTMQARRSAFTAVSR